METTINSFNLICVKYEFPLLNKKLKLRKIMTAKHVRFIKRIYYDYSITFHILNSISRI